MKKLSFIVIVILVAFLSACSQNNTVECDACGASASVDMKFCSECGANLVQETTIAPENTVASETTITPDTTVTLETTVASEATSVPETTVPPHNHTWSSWTTTLDATCTGEGKQERSCECGEKETTNIAALGHTEVIDNGVAATCITSGLSEGRHCNICGVVTVIQQYVSAMGHSEVLLSAVAPTCTQEGKTDGKICNRCQVIFVAQTQIPAIGHSEIVDKAVAPTCTQTGLSEGKHCSVCNLVIVEQITVKALGHTEVIDKAVAATCTTSGKTEGKHCSKCNLVILSQNTISATGHNYNSGTITKSATCTADGQKVFVCINKNCNHSYEETFKATTYSATELYDLSVKYVGEIITYDKSGKELALGTGFVYSSDGKIITNYHVIDDAYSAAITINGKTYNIVSILAYDEDIDLAVLKVDASNLISANVCKQPTKTGENIYAIGSSRGLTNTFSQGIITQSNRKIDGVSYIQHDASITNGNSGGPLINVYGEVIGINTWGITDSQNLNFAVFVSELDNLVYGKAMTWAEFYEANSNAYETLLNWVLENYNYTGDSWIDYRYKVSGERYSICSLTYYYNSDRLTLQYYYVFSNDDVLYISIDLTEDTTSAYYYASYTDGDYSYRKNVTKGYIYPPSFTRNTSIGYSSSEGDYWTIDSLLALYQSGMVYSLEWLDWFLEAYNLGFTLSDLGFASFQ